MTVANTLAYYSTATITVVKSFLVQVEEPCIKNLDMKTIN